LIGFKSAFSPEMIILLRHAFVARQTATGSVVIDVLGTFGNGDFRCRAGGKRTSRRGCERFSCQIPVESKVRRWLLDLGGGNSRSTIMPIMAGI
jgi:hypothetical protein